MTGNVEPGLPPFSFPNLTPTVGNHTYTLPEVVEELGVGIFIIPTVAVLANVAIAKAFSKFLFSFERFICQFFLSMSWRNSLTNLIEVFSWNCTHSIQSIQTFLIIFCSYIFTCYFYLSFNHFYLLKEC